MAKARVKTKILMQSRRRQKPIFESRSVYFGKDVRIAAARLKTAWTTFASKIHWTKWLKNDNITYCA